MASKDNVSSVDGPVIDVKPLRTLSPLFPQLPGTNSFTAPNFQSMVCVTPFGSNSSDQWYGEYSFFPQTSTTPGGKGSSKGLTIGPIINSPWNNLGQMPSPRTPIAKNMDKSVLKGKRKLKSDEDENTSTRKTRVKKEPVVKANSDVAVPQAFTSDNPRECVEVVLMTFDALRRRLVQLDEVKDGKQRNDNKAMKAGSIMMANDLRLNKAKVIGHIPGVEVGDIFYSRIEMCLVGLNNQTVAGIDYISAKSGAVEETLAVSIISAGVYENNDDDPNVLIYSGQGMANKDDQKLERGNLALSNSKRKQNMIRVIRGVKEGSTPSSKIYIYDGLFSIQDSWVEKAKTGFSIFKHKLLREPDQPDGFISWKLTEKWLENPSTRRQVVIPDISNGLATHPVCVVNEINNEKPKEFVYATKVIYKVPLSSLNKQQDCECKDVCLPCDDNCSCRRHNGGELPYGVSGLLVCRKNVLYECTNSCKCPPTCRNRATQRGTGLHFEVFRTRNRGWGLRCWEPIRAGTFICEYTGEAVDEASTDLEDNEYIFRPQQDDQYFRWNYGPELLGESTQADSRAALQLVLSAKNTGNVSRFMNHSCSPNVIWQPVLYDHGDERYPHIMLFASRHIPPMAELTLDYGPVNNSAQTGSSRTAVKSTICLCGSENCRGAF